ncbi:hypothetical protein CLG94_09105 [Candidatus Methylomirabilis limnetica]|uniref:Fibronectin type-III domain-containing protein n=1 Tax=Candidatus Methylomirabilis limnetica TaxID=2033718 RepID=A0A2T4TXQ7_9BACT|nr:right-handed parallel beta-helix repeat-containing protein [Candidatus Methylomirabilis limnetica]PTL35898.1 hypothetical protein CLG94_09105 [Candidatus Methylomirabilis limnetica]
MFSVQSKSCLNVLPLALLRVAFTLALAFVFTGVVGTYAEAATRLPDLIVSAVSAPSTAQPGQSFVLSASIKNQGRASASTVQAAFYLTKSASSITGATLLGTQNVGSLSAGAVLALTTTLSIPSSTSPGTFYVATVADPTKIIKESKETNNTRASSAIAVKDLTPPTISGVNATGITANNATITWTTDKTSTSQADYGTTAAYGSATAPNSSLVTSHAVTLSGLTAGKAYHFRAQSKDAAGNAALSSDYTFTTATATTTTATAGNTYYVATTGNDGYPGTETQPFRTLSRGVSVLIPGDTLYVMSGTYAESLMHNIPAGTSWSAPITVAAAPGHTVTLKPDLGAEFVLHFQGPQQYIVIDGLILDGANATYGVVKITWSVSGDPTTAAHHIRLQNSEVRNASALGGQASGQGVLVAGQADWNEFINLNVHHNGLTSFDHGFYIQSSHNVVEHCSVHDNAGYGVHLYNEYGRRTDSNVVRNNAVFNNGWRGILLGSGDGNIAYNNVVWGNRGGIRVSFGNPTNSKVYNNTTYNNTDYGILVETGTGAIAQNNIAYMNGTPEIQDTATSSVIGHNLVGIDPQFVNAAAADFRLQPGSLAIDAGIAVSLVTTDIAGTLRPQGRGDDIGAFEMIP